MATKVESVEIEFLAKIEDLKAKIESIPNITAKEAKKMAAAFTAEWKKAKKGAEETSNAVQVVAKDAGKLAKLGGLLGGSFGGALNNIGDLSELAADGIGGMALAAGGLGLAVAGVAALGTAVASVLTDLDSYRGILSDLEKRHVVSPEQAQMIEVTSAAITVLKKYASEFAVILTANVAPAVANFLKGSVFAFTFLKSFVGSIFDDIGKTIGAFWNVITSGFSKDSLTEFSTAFLDMSNVVDNFKESATVAIDATNQFIKDSTQESTRASSEYYAKDREAFQKAQQEKVRLAQQAAAKQAAAAKQLSDFLQGIAEKGLSDEGRIMAARAADLARVADLAKQAGLDEAAANDAKNAVIADSERQILELREAYAAQARQIVTDAVDWNISEEDRLKREKIKKLEEYSQAARAAHLSESETAQGIASITKSYTDQLKDQEIEKIKQTNAEGTKSEVGSLQERAAAANMYLQGVSNVWGAIGDLYQSVSDAHIRTMKEGSKEQKKALKAQFFANKAIALVQAGINTALGITQALTMPPPASYIMAALTAAAGAVQIGLIAASKPSFHTGGVVGRYQPDEVPAKLTQGEAVLTKPAVQRLGGANAVNALNGGYGSMQPALSTSVTVLDGRIIDALWQGDMRGRNGLAAKVSGHIAGRRSHRR